MKRKHEATLSYLERLQEAYQVLEAEREALVLSNTMIDGEKKDLEGKISGLETQRAAADKQVEELKARVEELEAQNNYLEVLFKETNERKIDITPLQEHALLLSRKIYQFQLKLVEEVYKIKQVETRLQEISVISMDFRMRTLEIAEIIQGQLIWLETNA